MELSMLNLNRMLNIGGKYEIILQNVDAKAVFSCILESTTIDKHGPIVGAIEQNVFPAKTVNK